jgi:DnaJ-class molecular chaperone
MITYNFVGLRLEAKEKFTQIKTAYETLIDDKLRALYDKFGAEGLKTGWELAARTKTTEEVLSISQKSYIYQMLKEFEKLKKREEERLLDSRVHARSAITMSMSAADLRDSLTGKLNILEVTGMSLSQSVKVTSIFPPFLSIC